MQSQWVCNNASLVTVLTSLKPQQRPLICGMKSKPLTCKPWFLRDGIPSSCPSLFSCPSWPCSLCSSHPDLARPSKQSLSLSLCSYWDSGRHLEITLFCEGSKVRASFSWGRPENPLSSTTQQKSLISWHLLQNVIILLLTPTLVA